MHTVIAISLFAGAALLVAAALHDIVGRTVPNGVAAALAIAGIVVQAIQGTLLYGLPAALLVFVVAAICWRRGWMGGGDVKLLGAAALLVPPWLVPSLITGTALSGGVLALLYLAARRRMPRPSDGRPVRLLSRVWRVERWRLRRGGPMPYAVAIASGAILVLVQGGLP